jgi:ankyrin repeat protein
VNQALLNHGVALHILDSSKGFTPLHSAADEGSVEIAEILIAAGADSY